MRFRADRLGIRLAMTVAAAASWLSGIAVPGVIGSSKMLAVVILATAWLADFSGSLSLPTPGRKDLSQGGVQEVRLEPEPTNTGAVLFVVFLLLLLLGGGLAFLFLVFAAMGGCCR